MELLSLWRCSLNHRVRPYHFSARRTSAVFQHIDHFAIERYLNLKMISTDDVSHAFVTMVSIISCCFTGGFLLKIALYLWKDERERAGKRTRCMSSAWAPEGGLEDSAVPSPTSTFPELLCSVFRLWEGCGSSLLLRVFKSCDFYSPLTPPRPPSLPPSSFFVSLKSSLSIAGSYLDSNHLFLKLIPMKSVRDFKG